MKNCKFVLNVFKILFLFVILFGGSVKSDELQSNLDIAFDRLGELKNNFSNEQIDKLNNNESIIILDQKQDRKYPNVYIFSMLDATPEELTAVFIDYNRHKDYFENGKLEKSIVSKRVTKTNSLVDYKLEVAKILFYTIIEEYTLDYKLYTYMDNLAYRVDRILVIPGKHLKLLEGVARAEPYEDKTLISYYGYMDPGIKISDKESIEKISYVVEQLKKQAMHEKENDKELLRQQIQSLRDCLQ